ncbi:MAG: hypothetical protein HOV81_25870 [Kofleriaceae bacterium]|nr:hypothetical protein [Kofleriaceae bacterium]
MKDLRPSAKPGSLADDLDTGSPFEHAIDEARLQSDLDPPIGLHPRHRDGLVLVTMG